MVIPENLWKAHTLGAENLKVIESFDGLIGIGLSDEHDFIYGLPELNDVVVFVQS